MVNADSTLTPATTPRQREQARLETSIRRKLRLQADPVWTLREVAIILSCDYATIHALIASGRLDAFQIGRRGAWRIRQSALVKLK